MFWFLLAALPAAPACAGWSLGLGTEYMSWREYDFAREELLEESGARTFAEAALAVPFSNRAEFQLYGRVYAGDVDYDGQYQDGTPLTTVTEYTGIVGEAGVGYAAGMRSGAGEPPRFIARGGVERWQRNITGSGGYEEEYQVAYLRLGAEQAAPQGGWTARGGVLWPLAVQEHIKLLDGIDLEPEGKLTFYFGMGYRWRSGLEAAFNYQIYRFQSSDPVGVDWTGDGVDDGYVYQPRSELDTYGIALKYNY